MRFDIVTIFPELFANFRETSLVGKAVRDGRLELEVHDLREHTTDRHRSVDDEPYGGGGGMVMKAEPWLAAVRAISDGSEASSPGQPTGSPHRVLLSPQGDRLDEHLVKDLAERNHVVLMCGRYEAVDERVHDLVVDQEVSIGDFVLSGGEVAAMVVVEAVSRQIPGVVGLADSVVNDSFRDGLLDYPHYTRPEEVEGLRVPDVLRSGDHAAIAAWRRERSIEATRRKRPDLWRRWLDREQEGAQD